jgi:hypothetical protein
MFEIEHTETKTTKITYKIDKTALTSQLKNKLFYTLSLSVNEKGKKVGKHPPGWQNIEKQQFNKSHNAIAFLTGSKNNIYVVDYDNKLNFKIDSELFPELKNYYEETRKGFHCYFLYSKYEQLIGSKNIKKHDIDFLGDGKCVYASPTSYNTENGNNIKVCIKNAGELRGMTEGLFNYFNKKYIKENIIEEKKENIIEEKKEVVDEGAGELDEILNTALGCKGLKFAYEAVPNYKNSYKIWCTNNYGCLVTMKHTHHEPKHSMIFACKKYIGFQCWAHGKKDFKVFIDDEEKANILSNKIKVFLGIKKKKKIKSPKKNNYQILLGKVWEDCSKNKYKKEDGWILKAVDNVPTFYEKYLEYKDYLNVLFSCRETEEDENMFWGYRNSPRIIQNLIDYLEHYNDLEIPFIVRDKYHITYLNGVLDIKKMKFYTWGEHPSLCSGIMFPNIFELNWLNIKFNKLETPIFDKLIKHQIHNNKTYKMFCMMAGRLFFDIGEFDNWQCMMFIHGQGNTGKGTFIELMKRFFNNPGILSSTFEKTFGLQNLYDKEVIIAPDLPKKINELLSGSCLQSMISGEGVSVSVKNKKAIQVSDWKAPMLWCANFFPNYEDNAGSITRRFAIFKMTTEVQEKDTKLLSTLLQESHITCIKLIKAYHYYVGVIGDVAFDKWSDKLNINCFKNETTEFKQESNLLYQFLKAEPGMNKTKNSNKVIIFKENCYTPLESLKKSFKFFLQYKHQAIFHKYTWSSTIEESAIKSCGFFIEEIYQCIGCANKKTCKPKCNKNNRRKMKMIKHMLMKDLMNDDECDMFEDLHQI